MTRKRVGQGLIEAFSTTCESCHGRGIHIHTDPVPMAASSRNMEAREDEDREHDGVQVDEVADSEPVAASSEQQGMIIVDTPAQSPVSSGRRGRRRVSSGGVITPSV